MTDRMTKDEHIPLLKTAIVANLTACIERDKRQEAERQGQPPKLKIWDAADLMAADPQRLDLDSIIADPVRCALRKQLKNLGQRLYSLLGSTGLMATSQTKSPSSHRTSVAEEMVQAILMERHRAGLH